MPMTVLGRAALILAARTLGDIVPFAGPVFADLFTAHKWAAGMVVEAIDRRLGVATAPPRNRWWQGRSAVAV